MAQRGRETFGPASLEDWERLCSEGFGLVYKAKHKDLGINVVIKLADDDDSGTIYAGLCQEADYMAAADHKYVPRFYGMYQGPVPGLGPKKMHGIVMELMEGGSLLSFLKTLSKPPPWPLAFRLAHQVALAMDFLHKQDLVHMDLKPDNVLLDANFNAKIADFGFSTVSDGACQGGTVAYTPPEAFKVEYRCVQSYDVYSYGILLWTILTGESNPYPGVDQALLAIRIKKGDRPDLRKIDVQKAAGLEDLVDLMKRCWDPEPKKRPLFGECVEVTRRVFSRHEEGIRAAVSDISKQLAGQPNVPMTSEKLQSFTPIVNRDHSTNEYSSKLQDAGLFECRNTGLAFQTTGETTVQYKAVEWKEEWLQSTGGIAGPLFDIKCLQEGAAGPLSLSQLRLPHCLVTPGDDDLSVAHITEEGVEFLKPVEVTQTHVVVNVTHLSLFGLIYDKLFKPKPIHGQVLLFLRRPSGILEMNVFLLPDNVDIEKVKSKFYNREDEYINTPTACLLTPEEVYSLHCPPHDVQPEDPQPYHEKFGPNFSPTFVAEMDLNTEVVSLEVQGPEKNTVWRRRCRLNVKGMLGKTLGGEMTSLLPPPEKAMASTHEDTRGPSVYILVSNKVKLVDWFGTDLHIVQHAHADGVIDRRAYNRVKNTTPPEAACIELIDSITARGEGPSSQFLKLLINPEILDTYPQLKEWNYSFIPAESGGPTTCEEGGCWRCLLL